ncbi:MAG: hypothetical protein OET81_03475 [Desulfobacteraceae bacterium]|nr:hypothetical protein [Desulfobacteraceae bacterium]
MKKESSYQNQYNRAPDMSIKSISKYISKLKYYRKHPAEEAKTTTGRATPASGQQSGIANQSK